MQCWKKWTEILKFTQLFIYKNSISTIKNPNSIRKRSTLFSSSPITMSKTKLDCPYVVPFLLVVFNFFFFLSFIHSFIIQLINHTHEKESKKFFWIRRRSRNLIRIIIIIKIIYPCVKQVECLLTNFLRRDKKKYFSTLK